MKQLSSSEFKSFIYGTMLGDSCIHKNGKEFNCQQITKDLMEYKYEVIKRNLPDANIKFNVIPAHYDGKWYHQDLYRLRVKHPYFRKIYDVFYKDGKKRVDKKILDALKPNGYAVWYADDGTTTLIGKNNFKTNGRLNNRRIEICTDGFIKEDVELIAKHFNTKYNLKCKLVQRSDTNFRLRIPNKPGQQFLVDIYKEFYNYPSMLYKMDMGYRDESLSYRRYVTEDYEKLYQSIKMHSEFIDRLNFE